MELPPKYIFRKKSFLDQGLVDKLKSKFGKKTKTYTIINKNQMHTNILSYHNGVLIHQTPDLKINFKKYQFWL